MPVFPDAAPEEVENTALPPADSHGWNTIGYYYDSSKVPPRMIVKDKSNNCLDSPTSGSMFSASNYVSKSIAVTPDETNSLKKEINTSYIKKYSTLLGNNAAGGIGINTTSNSTSAVNFTSTVSLVKPPLGPAGCKRLPLSVPRNSGNKWQYSFQQHFLSDVFVRTT